MDRKSLLAQVRVIAREAGVQVMQVYRRQGPIRADSKADNTPVTEADLAAHQLIIASLGHLTPEIPILSEESDAVDPHERRRWETYWLVDPLDGTKEFLKRNGEFTVNIALIHHGQPQLGVVYVPVSQTTYSGLPGFGAFKQVGQGKEQRIRTHPLTPYKKITLLTSRSHPSDRLDSYVQRLEQIAPVTQTPVGSSLKLCLIAEGMADIHLRLGTTCEWDTAASQAVLTAAGGQVCDLNGTPLRYNQRDQLYNPEFVALADPAFRWFDHL